MTQRTIIFLTLITVLPVHTGSTTSVAPYIPPHPISFNLIRDHSGWQPRTETFSSDTINGSLTITPYIDTSFREKRIIQCLFGEETLDCKETFTVSGSRTERMENDWFADNFGLPTDYVSTVFFKPTMHNIGIVTEYTIGLDRCLPGAYIQLHIPLVYTRWHMQLFELVDEKGTNTHDAGYLSDAPITRNNLSNSFRTFMSGNSVPTADGITFEPLRHARICGCPLTKTHIAEIIITGGYELARSEKCHLGIRMHGGIPCGNRPTGAFLFEPIAGNGHHASVGVGLDGHVRIWEMHDEAEYAELHGHLDMRYLFSTEHTRVFDLKNKPNSRYMLAAQLATSITNSLRGQPGAQTPSAQFNNRFSSVANLTTATVSSAPGAMAQFSIGVLYRKYNTNWTLGYGLTKRGCETLTQCSRARLQDEQWGLKGDAHVIGFENSAGNPPIPLSATQSKASIIRGQNFPPRGTIDAAVIATAQQNLRSDNPLLAESDSDANTTFDEVRTQPGGTNQINTSVNPILLTRDDINFDGARTRYGSNVIFAHVHHWWDDIRFTPHLGIGGQVTFGGSACHTPANCTDECLNSAFSTWSIWIKAGISFVS